MRYACKICEKKVGVGRSQTHGRGIAGKRWKNRAQSTRRTFRPNLQKKTLIKADGSREQMRLCTKCIKRIKKYGSVKDYKKVAFA